MQIELERRDFRWLGIWILKEEEILHSQAKLCAFAGECFLVTFKIDFSLNFC